MPTLAHLALLVLPLLVLARWLGAAETGPAKEDGTASASTDEEMAVVERTNDERKKAGLSPLKISPRLAKAARVHSANMARTGELTHDRMQERVAEAGYNYLAIAENVAWNQQSPAEVLKSWMQSAGHRANIVNREYTEIGVGIARDKENSPYYTQIFGRPGEAGMTAAATFSIKNNTARDVDMGWTGLAAKPLEPGVKKTYSISGLGELPSFRIVLNGRSQDLKYQNGATYAIEETEKGIEVKNAGQ